MTPVSLTMFQQYSAGPVASPLTPLETPPNPSLDLLTTEADEEDELEENLLADIEQTSEVEKILQDLENGVVDETLPRLIEEDVAFEMDEVVVEEEEIVEEEEDDNDDTDDDENDIRCINAEEQE